MSTRLPEVPGVYRITAKGGRYYIGSSMNLRRRIADHIRRGPSSPLGSAVAKAEVLEVCSDASTPACVRKREQTWLERAAGDQLCRNWNAAVQGGTTPRAVRVAMAIARYA